jgi:site-specific recombinase XerD
MASILDRFCRFLERAERSPLTVRVYRSDLEGMARWFEGQNGGKFAPGKITPTDLRDYKRWLAGQDLKPASINRKLASLKSFLNWAVDVRLLRRGHGLRVPRAIREARRGPRWLDRREQHRLMRAVEHEGKIRDIAAVRLLLNTGLRVAEFCAVNWKDVRLSDRQGTLTVRKGKGSKRRQIPLNKDARHALLSFGYGEHAGRATPIFVGQRGPLTPRGFQIFLAPYVRAADLKDVTPHSLRHSFCKNLVNAGVSLEKVAALAGHESLETTRRYCEPSLQDLQQAVEMVSEEE